LEGLFWKTDSQAKILYAMKHSNRIKTKFKTQLTFNVFRKEYLHQLWLYEISEYSIDLGNSGKPHHVALKK